MKIELNTNRNNRIYQFSEGNVGSNNIKGSIYKDISLSSKKCINRIIQLFKMIKYNS